MKIWRRQGGGWESVPDWQLEQEQRSREFREGTGRAGRELARTARIAARAERKAKRKARRAARPAAVPVPGSLRAPRATALWAIAALVLASAGVSFAESYRGLWLWARHHGLSGLWADIWPLQVDVFIAVGELALFVALVDGWRTRSRTAAWIVTGIGLAVSVAGNVGHITAHSLTSRATAAIPPLAAAAALAVGLGVLKRVVENQPQDDAGRQARCLVPGAVPSSVLEAAKASMTATLAAGNPLSVNQLAERFSLTRGQATKIRQSVLGESNGQAPE